jgi:uncharacterized membrane protein YedE/YeeE
MNIVHNLVLAVAGGALIGLAAGLFMLIEGRIMGASSLVAGLVGPVATMWRENALLLIGLPLGALLFAAIGGAVAPHLAAPPLALVVGGLLVGFGTRLSAGCTSGHGVCGNARLSPRSMAATAAFMLAGMAAVALGRLV